MADFSTVAHPYAKAVFELARDSGDYKAWGESLQALAALFGTPEVAALTANPSLTRADLSAALAQSLGAKLPAPAVTLVRLLVENHRLPALPAIAAEYERLRDEAEKRVEVEITSAATIDAAQQEKLVAAVRQRLARDVAVSWQVDPALIGGAVIRTGDMVLDGSYAGELARLKTVVTQ